ncbi:MAG: CinA family nicotinamide mononucleotide deamidase-related protein [Saprospiraceae bacterium]
MKAILLTIGNEILSGQVVDTNAAWLAQQLLAIGIPVKEKWSVGDELAEIIEALEHASLKGDLVITTGGLGPTADDLTCEALARFMQVERIFHEHTFENLTKIFASFGRIPTESHRIQCLLPAGVKVLPNIAGTAPGMYFNHKGVHLISMPGVPFEMKAIFDPHVIELLNTVRSGPRRSSHTFNTIGEGETVLEDLIKDITDSAPRHISFAFLPDIYKVRIRVDLDSENENDVKDWLAIIDALRMRLLPYLVGENEITLEIAIGNLLKNKNWMMGTAESCTGGYVAHTITSIAGSSEYFKGSIIAYQNNLKMDLLSVPEQTLMEHGSVSEETVQAMAKGALSSLDIQVSVAISGIAGPGGGTKEKPVGLVWIALADCTGKLVSKKIQLRRDRLLNIRASSTMALILLYRFLLNE